MEALMANKDTVVAVCFILLSRIDLRQRNGFIVPTVRVSLKMEERQSDIFRSDAGGFAEI
jgi:hypothetical protein